MANWHHWINAKKNCCDYVLTDTTEEDLNIKYDLVSPVLVTVAEVEH